MTGRVRLPGAVRRAIATHARETAPAECCGFLLGRGTSVAFAIRMVNIARDSRRRYRVDDRAHLAWRRLLRDVQPPLAIVGVYHSHPRGASAPSATDRAEAHYPSWIHIIAAVQGRRVRLGAYRIRAGRVRRLTIE